MTWSWQFAWGILPQLLSGLLVTVKASLLASVIALLLGVPVAIVRYKRIPVLGPVLTIIVDFLRGTPLLVQLYFVYYALPTFGLTLPAFTAGVLTLGLYTTAYTAETYRAGIESVPSGQWDATSALSLPARAAWIRVVIPQAVRAPLGWRLLSGGLIGMATVIVPFVIPGRLELLVVVPVLVPLLPQAAIIAIAQRRAAPVAVKRSPLAPLPILSFIGSPFSCLVGCLSASPAAQAQSSPVLVSS